MQAVLWGKKKGEPSAQPCTVPVRTIAYSVVPLLKSRDIEPVVPAKLPIARAWNRNVPVGVVAPWPVIWSANVPICAEPEETVYVAPLTVRLPLVSESVYPCESFAVAVKVSVPEAVPLLLGVPITKYFPCVLVIVMVCPTARLTELCGLRYLPPGPAWK